MEEVNKNTEVDNTDKKLHISDVIKSLLPNKCEYCGCYDGIHRTDCSFMRRYW
jgi:hypothetical protein